MFLESERKCAWFRMNSANVPGIEENDDDGRPPKLGLVNAPGIEENDGNGKPPKMNLDPSEEKEEQTEAPVNAPGIEEGGACASIFNGLDLDQVTMVTMAHRWAVSAG